MNLQRILDNTGMEELEFYLVVSILLMVIIAMVTLSISFMKRNLSLREEKRKIHYQKELEAMISELLFKEPYNEELLQKLRTTIRNSPPLFTKLAIKQLKNLYNHYTGSYQATIQKIFAESELRDYTFSKLKSKNWMKNIEGIRDLSLFNQKTYVDEIKKFKTHQKSNLREETFLALYKLMGNDVLAEYADSDLSINDWTQSKVIDLIKRNRIPPPTHIENYFQSKNLSYLKLLMRLIKYYNLTEYKPLLEELTIPQANKDCNKERMDLVQYLTQLDQYDHDR